MTSMDSFIGLIQLYPYPYQTYAFIKKEVDITVKVPEMELQLRRVSLLF